jgi:hypothetical protein
MVGGEGIRGQGMEGGRGGGWICGRIDGAIGSLAGMRNAWVGLLLGAGGEGRASAASGCGAALDLGANSFQSAAAGSCLIGGALCCRVGDWVGSGF